MPGEGEVRAELSQLFEVSLSTTRIDPLLEGLRLFARFCGSSFYARRRLQWYNRGPLTPNGSQMTVAGHFHLLQSYVLRAVLTPLHEYTSAAAGLAAE